MADEGQEELPSQLTEKDLVSETEKPGLRDRLAERLDSWSKSLASFERGSEAQRKDWMEWGSTKPDENPYITFPRALVANWASSGALFWAKAADVTKKTAVFLRDRLKPNPETVKNPEKAK